MTASALQGLLTATLLGMCVLLGGGQGTLGDTACQVLALGLIAWVLWRHARGDARLPWMAWLGAAVFVLPVLQLLPLPDALWQLPPARADLARDLAAAGAAPASRWSLNPVATERAALWLLPAVALFLSMLQLDGWWRRRLLALLVALAVLSLLLGLAQVAGGRGNALYFYSITNPGAAVGFFANRNHFASLLAVALPLVVVGAAASLGAHADEDRSRRLLRLAIGAGLVAMLVLGLAIARSRAGLVLGMVGVLLSLPVALGLRQGRGTRRFLVFALGLGAVLVVQFGLYGILQRLGTDPMDDARFRMAPVAAQVAREHAPLGAGLGNFRRAFEARDPAPQSEYINHAHNDWLQLWLEGGWPGLALGLAGMGLLAGAAWTALRAAHREPSERRDRALRLACAIGITLLALHSLGDYPLRTTALLAVLGLLAAGTTATRVDRAPDAGRAALPDRA